MKAHCLIPRFKFFRLAAALAATTALTVALPGAMDHTKHAMQAELGAAAVFDSNGILWAAHKQDLTVAVSRSDDQGKSWSSTVIVTPAPEVTDAGGDAHPKIALGPKGEIYVTWTRPMKTPYSGEIRLARSLDGGRTFLPPITVHQNPDDITHRFDAIAVNRKGQVFVTWVDKRDGIAATKEKIEYKGAAVYFAVSDDQGATFRGDFKVADNTCECCRLAITVRADDSVYAMWRHIFAPNIRDHAIAQLFPDGHVGSVIRATFDDWHVDGCPHHGPSIAEDNSGRLHAVWFTMTANAPQVFYGRLRDGGVEKQRRIGGDSASHPDLAVIGNRVAVAWKEFDGERAQLLAMVSENGGESWQEHKLGSSDGASDQPRVLTVGDRFLVLWNTRSNPLSVTPLP